MTRLHKGDIVLMYSELEAIAKKLAYVSDERFEDIIRALPDFIKPGMRATRQKEIERGATP